MRDLFARPLRQKQEGFTLVEILAALFISFLIMAALGLTFVLCVKTGRAANQRFQKYRELRPFMAALQRELRSMVPYEKVPFRGNDESMEFLARGKNGEGRFLRKIRYRIENHHPVREESALKGWPENKEAVKKIFSLETKNIRFEYPYTDGGRIRYLPFWLEEPYRGLPAAVRVTVEAGSGEEGFRFVKLIDIPQGKLGVLPHGDEEFPV